MSRVEDLADSYGRHIATPWQRTVAGAQRVIMVVYEKDMERTVRARKDCFRLATTEAQHDWHEVDISNAFSTWMASTKYRQSYFESPDKLKTKLDAVFPEYVAGTIREALTRPEVSENSVVALFGVGALLGFTRVSQVIKMVEADIKGRLVVFFPGQFESNNYRLLDARDGWNYMAVPISLHSEGNYL